MKACIKDTVIATHPFLAFQYLSPGMAAIFGLRFAILL